jgi:hypothetical protein
MYFLAEDSVEKRLLPMCSNDPRLTQDDSVHPGELESRRAGEADNRCIRKRRDRIRIPRRGPSVPPGWQIFTSQCPQESRFADASPTGDKKEKLILPALQSIEACTRTLEMFARGREEIGGNEAVKAPILAWLALVKVFGDGGGAACLVPG